MSSSLQFQLPILVYLLSLSSFSFYAAANFFYIDVISELIDPLYIDCVMNGNIVEDKVGLKQSNAHRYPVKINTGRLEPTLLCNMTASPRYGTFLLFKFYRDIPRCDIRHKRCTWNIMQDGLYLYYNYTQNLVFNWSMSPISYNVDVISELIDPLYINCEMNGVMVPRVGLKQSNLHRYVVPVNNTGTLVPKLLCTIHDRTRIGLFLLFDLNRDGTRCEELRCTWNIMLDGLYLFYNNTQNLVFNWSMLPMSYNVDVISELIDPLYIDCEIDSVMVPRVGLKQSNLHRYIVPVNNTGTLVPNLLCNMTAGNRIGHFLLFDLNRDGKRCEELRCTWNIMEHGLYLFFNNSINRVYNWSLAKLG